jgi:metal-responsive CopG/Arc/MetJ family transcriptional regulator
MEENMATEPTPLISADLLHQVEETAREQNRQPEEVVSEAVRKYLEEQSWVRFVERNESRARAMGITEDDIPRLVDEVRRENAARGK